MPTFQNHKIVLEAETSMRGDEIKEYLEKKLAKGRLRISPDTISAEMLKKPRKSADEKAE